MPGSLIIYCCPLCVILRPETGGKSHILLMWDSLCLQKELLTQKISPKLWSFPPDFGAKLTACTRTSTCTSHTSHMTTLDFVQG